MITVLAACVVVDVLADTGGLDIATNDPRLAVLYPEPGRAVVYAIDGSSVLTEPGVTEPKMFRLNRPGPLFEPLYAVIAKSKVLDSGIRLVVA